MVVILVNAEASIVACPLKSVLNGRHKTLRYCVSVPGSLLTVRGLLTFSSARSMEIEVVVELENIFHHSADSSVTATTKGRAVDAFFTFVSIDNQGKALPVPPLQVINCIIVAVFISNMHDIRSDKTAIASCFICLFSEQQPTSRLESPENNLFQKIFMH